MSGTSVAARPRSRRVLRRVGALFAGLLVNVVPTLAIDAALHAAGFFRYSGPAVPDSHFVVATLYRIVFGVPGCWVAARLAPDRPMGHALSLGVLGLVASIAGAFATWDRGPEFGPKWYPIAIIAIALPCAWLGGRFHARRVTSPA